MKRFKERFKDERGQVLVLVAAIGMAAIAGAGALAIDAGSWLHAQRQLQSGVDSAALAGAQDLPAATGVNDAGANAQTTASAFMTQNVGQNPDTESQAVSVTFPAPSGTGCDTTDCLAVSATRPSSGILSGLLGFFGVTVHANAQAYVGQPSSLNNVSSAAIPLSSACVPPSCTLPKNNVTLSIDTSSPLLDLKTHSPTDDTIVGTTNSTTTMNNWVEFGYPSALPVNNWYAVDNGAHDGVKTGFKYDLTNGITVIIPVYTSVYPTSGSITAYYVVGFAAFKITQVVQWSNCGGCKVLQGNLVRWIASGLPGGPGGSTNFGVFVVGING